MKHASVLHEEQEWYIHRKMPPFHILTSTDHIAADSQASLSAWKAVLVQEHLSVCSKWVIAWRQAAVICSWSLSNLEVNCPRLELLSLSAASNFSSRPCGFSSATFYISAAFCYLLSVLWKCCRETSQTIFRFCSVLRCFFRYSLVRASSSFFSSSLFHLASDVWFAVAH